MTDGNATQTSKARDVLVLNATGGFVYLHHIGRHPEYGDTVLVSPILSKTKAVVTGEIFSRGYVAFYPATAAVAQALAEIVDHLPPPDVPQLFRRPGARSGRRIDTWVIENGIKRS